MTRNEETPRFCYLTEEQRSFSLCSKIGMLTEYHVEADDGTQLRVYEAGHSELPTVALINPLGVSCVFLLSLMSELVERYHVLTWESRGLPNQGDVVFSDAACAWPLELQCADLQAILRARGRQECHALVAYCSGASIAVASLAGGAVNARALCLVSPSLTLPKAGRKTAYQQSVLSLWPRVIAEGPRFASLVRSLLRQGHNQVASPLDFELMTINDLPFQSDESVWRYAQLLAPAVQCNFEPWLQRVLTRTLVLHAENDEIVHPDTVRAVVRALPNAELAWISDGGHYAIHKSRELRARILRFLMEFEV